MPGTGHAHRACRISMALSLAALLCLSLSGGCQREGGGAEISVIAYTTMLETIVKEIGGDRVATTSLVPPGMAPEEFSLADEHIEKALDADLFVISGWEEWAPEILESGNRPENLAAIDIPGDLLLPYVHLDAADSVTEALVRVDPAGEVFYRYNRADYRSRLGIEAEEICAMMFGLADTRVICTEVQAEFLDYMGFDIVGTYGDHLDISSGEMAHLVEIGRKNAVLLVVDDAHDVGDTGERVADEIGAARVVLSRYPDGGSYLDLLGTNAEKIVAALR